MQHFCQVGFDECKESIPTFVENMDAYESTRDEFKAMSQNNISVGME